MARLWLKMKIKLAAANRIAIEKIRVQHPRFGHKSSSVKIGQRAAAQAFARNWSGTALTCPFQCTRPSAHYLSRIPHTIGRHVFNCFRTTSTHYHFSSIAPRWTAVMQVRVCRRPPWLGNPEWWCMKARTRQPFAPAGDVIVELVHFKFLLRFDCLFCCYVP